MSAHPPLLEPPAALASLQADGSRRTIQPADVSGRYTSARRLTFLVLGVVLVGLPWVRVGGNPAVLLDIAQRTFFLGGRAFRAQDTFLLFFVLSGVGFALVATTTVFGRVWCGFACPQTVFTDGVFRRLERLVEGSAEERRHLAAGPWTARKIAKKAVLHAAYLLAATVIAHTVLGYFFPIRELLSVIAAGPRAHPDAFAWTTSVTALCYFDFGWFREQFCIVMCPYGRLQTTMTDADTLVVGYDAKRGEPRGKLHVIGNGDCVDCKRCVAVCPTGIDIRQGIAQLECIGCAECVDACDAIMVKVGKPVGLIRRDSERGFAGGKTRLVRPRTIVYAVAAVAGLLVASIAFGRTAAGFEAAAVRPAGAPFWVDGADLRNVVRVHLLSKSSAPLRLHISAVNPSVTVIVSQPDVELSPMGAAEVPVLLSTPAAEMHGDREVTLKIASTSSSEERTLVVHFVGGR